MSDLSLIPLQDGYESQLSQDWDGATGTVYVLATPSYTPTTTNTYIVVNPGKTNMQIAEITDYDSTAKTLTVSSISFEKGLGISSTAQTHSTGSKVIISDNYQFWEDIQTSVNSKLDKNGGNSTVYATTAARDSALGGDGAATLPYTNIYVTATGLFYNYNLSDAAWQSIDTGTSPGNATEASAGLIRTDVAPSGIPVALIADNPKYDALAGTSGTPSTSNKYVTNDDTATAATADKVARRLATGAVTVPATPVNATDAVSKGYTDGISQMTVPLGESFTGATTPQPAVLINDLFQPLADGAMALGQTGGGTNPLRVGIKITPQSTVTISTINAYLILNSSQANGTLFKIETDTAGSPSGSVITNGTSSTVASSTLGTGDKRRAQYTFSTPPTLTANTPYWFIIEKTTGQATNYEWIQSTVSSNAYASFSGKYWNGSAWDTSAIMNIEIIASSQGSFSLWKSDGGHTVPIMRQVHGFCTTTGSANASGTLIASGDVPGFTSLSPATPYYLDTTAGTISTLGDGMFVGNGKSSTVLNIPVRKKMADGILYGYANNVVPTGLNTAKIKAMDDGFFIVANITDATAVLNCTISVYNGNGTNTRTVYLDEFSNGQRTTVTVPIRKGQIFTVASMASGSVEITFIPLI